MAGWPKIVMIVAASILIVVAAAYYFVTFDICDTRVEQQIPGPNNRFKLVIFHRDCGATVDFNTQVSVMSIGRIFSFDANPAFFSIAGQHKLGIRWFSPNSVSLIVPRGDRVYRHDQKAGSILIQYENEAR